MTDTQLKELFAIGASLLSAPVYSNPVVYLPMIAELSKRMIKQFELMDANTSLFCRFMGDALIDKPHESEDLKLMKERIFQLLSDAHQAAHSEYLNKVSGDKA